MNQTIFGSNVNEVSCEKMAQVILGEKPSNFSQSAWPRLKFILDSREKPNDIDAKFAQWLPHFSKCWAPLFNKDYASNIAKDPDLFELMTQMDHGENTFYEGWSGKSSMKLRNFLRYYISG